ncbi:hypothetical protein, partial [Flavihumibacter sp. CACIAM 22H1]|uniref:hypothetical protein n=1 Tax=Flavihumibacter sp. CACIAM 22H1 TaxID=1812911 RepID=UPI0025C39F71
DLPFYFLPSTIGYLYVRTLTTRKPFRFQSDWWRFLPVLLCMVDLSPLLLVGMAEKKEQVVQLVKGEASTLFQAGSITGFQFYLPVLLAVGLYHLLGILSMLTRYKILLERNLRNREDDQQQQPKLFQWLGSFTGLFTVFWLINSIDFIKTADDFTLTSFTQFQRIGTACILILTVVFFLLKAIPIWKRLQTGQTGS